MKLLVVTLWIEWLTTWFIFCKGDEGLEDNCCRVKAAEDRAFSLKIFAKLWLLWELILDVGVGIGEDLREEGNEGNKTDKWLFILGDIFIEEEEEHKNESFEQLDLEGKIQLEELRNGLQLLL